MTANNITGLTKTAGFQIGVRRTFPASQEEAWALVTSPEGIKLWLGDCRELRLEPGFKYETASGACGEIRIVKPLQQLRLTWQKAGWAKPSTVQVRIIPGEPGKATISFHQEHLSDAGVREDRKRFWEDVLETLKARLR